MDVIKFQIKLMNHSMNMTFYKANKWNDILNIIRYGTLYTYYYVGPKLLTVK